SSLKVCGRAIRIAVSPRPILTDGRSYQPARTQRDGIAEAESLLADDARPINPRRRARLRVRKDAARRRDEHKRIGNVRLTDSLGSILRAQRGLSRTRGGRIRCKSVARTSKYQVVVDRPGPDDAGEICQVAH